MLKILFIVIFLVSNSSFANELKQGVSFGNLTDGQKVFSPFTVDMQVFGKTLAPAGELKEGTGHHHIIINKSFIKEGEVIPADENHIHFGQAQSQAELKLAPGKYNLTLQLADGMHRSYGKAWSNTIAIVVE